MSENRTFGGNPRGGSASSVRFSDIHSAGPSPKSGHGQDPVTSRPRAGILPAMATTYDRFEKELKEIRMLNSTQALMRWDMETQMPPKGQELRAEQLGLVSGLVHEKSTSKAMGEWLEELSE